MAEETTEAPPAPQGPLVQEVIKLGLQDSPYLIPGEQVQAQFGIDENGDARLVIYVKDIEVLNIDPVSRQVKYKIVGLRQFVQPWDPGGSYLDPKFISPDDLVIGNV